MDTRRFTVRGLVFALICVGGPAAIAYWQFVKEFLPPDSPNDEPVIVEFRLEPTSVLPGDQATLVWNVLKADRVVIEPDLGQVEAIGGRQIQVVESRTFTLTASNANAVRVRPLAVTPAVPPTPVVHFTADPLSPLIGERTTLAWNVTNADSVVISGIGSVGVTGSREEIITVPRTYELHATNRFNETRSAQVAVSPKEWPAPILSLVAEPNPVIKGQSTTVSWESQFAKEVLIEPFGTVESSGKRSFGVERTLTVRAMAQGPGGARAADLIIEARQLVPVTIPKDQEIRIRLLQHLGSAISRQEEIFEAALQRDLKIGATTAARAGPGVWGRVVKIDAPGRSRGVAAIYLTVERLTLLDGSVVGIETDVAWRNKSSVGRDILRTLIGAGAGAAIGAALDGKSGAAKGAAGGAGAGITIGMIEQGEDVFLPAGMEMTFKIKTPVVREMVIP